MNLRRALALAMLAALLAGCSSGRGTPAPTTTSRPTTTTEPAAGQPELLEKLRSIEPLLVSNEERAFSHSKNVCMRSTESDMTHAKLIAYVRAEFEGGTLPIVTPAQAELILLSIRDTICR